VSIICVVVMVLLFASEIRLYLTPEVREELVVDTTRTGKLKINIDFVFSRVSCDFLVLDAMDVSGEQHMDLSHNIYKRRLDIDSLRPIEEPQKQLSIGFASNKTDSSTTTTTSTTTEKPACGSCYGAETEERKCCNTCNEVRDAYRAKTWKFDPRGVEQCKGEEGVESYSESEAKAFKEGCQIYGFIEVNRVGGSFHVAPGRSFSVSGVHVHDVQPFSSSDFNMTHKIRHLSFGRQLNSGDNAAQRHVNPLDGVEAPAEKGATMFQYYVKIVPTLYTKQAQGGSADETAAEVLSTYQFSVTRHEKVASLMDGSGMPGVFFSYAGVFFSYELAPVMVKYSSKSKSFGHFSTGLCAIIGGVFTVAGLIDKIFYSSSKLVQEKLDLGKAT